jgi:SRSO17 transposase
LLIEWPEGEDQPDHYWLATLPADISFERMVDLTKLRWRIERDYLELKQEVGLVTMKAAAGAAFTVMPLSASQLMVS